ncbi:LacI family DNA-binding transcriptional regulator [Mucilaginibacter sp. RCC_168]|jgi:LacI family transcriptional regulator|uniref:LacI family DNA-binding transcriptional regulator n=1 Tax=unclassified Mucilaginibacter TaxID=2617802 RepID=UPI00088DC464|nr:substrate-binding domain-containing protein [Mucilaginibacter sp. OK268]SDP14934.1 transcriptional regulator, LacI family [Mucilaginibacter sp. OK268]
MKKKLAIKDIASALNVSEASVSIVLNGKARQSGISVKLEDKIISFVKKVGYQPNRLAVGLRTGKSKTIGMIVEDISDPFFSAIARVVEEHIYQYGYRLIYGSSENSTEIANDLLQTFKNYQVDGYILAPAPALEEVLGDLIRAGTPVILFDRTLPGLPCSKVAVDNFRGSESATIHLIENDFRNIAFVTLSSPQDQMTERANGYLAALKAHDLPAVIKDIEFREAKEKTVQSIKNLLKGKPDIDALFFSTNYLALSGLEAIKELDMIVGQDIGVVVFDDNNNFSLFTPAITAVAQPIREIGLQVTKILLDQLQEDHMIDSQNILLKTKLIIRDSSAPLRKLD